MSTQLRAMKELLMSTRDPEKIFGKLSKEPDKRREEIHAAFRRMALLCHPDRFTSKPAPQRQLAEEVFKRLNEFKDAAEQGLEGPEVTSASTVITTARSTYIVGPLRASGEVADVYRGTYRAPDGREITVAIKIARDEEDNRLLLNESKILKAVPHVSLPKFIDDFVLPDGRRGNVLEWIPGYTLTELRKNPLHQKGLSKASHIGWILERQLAVLGHLHKAMVVHGNLTPDHLIVDPVTHNVVLVDFCFATRNPGAKDFTGIFTAPYSPKEVEKKASPLPTQDLYALGKCAIYLLGGDPEKSELPPNLPTKLESFINKLVDEDESTRARDAYKMAHRILHLREEIFGPRVYEPLPV